VKSPVKFDLGIPCECPRSRYDGQIMEAFGAIENVLVCGEVSDELVLAERIRQ
jgi:hypothetical protein